MRQLLSNYSTNFAAMRAPDHQERTIDIIDDDALLHLHAANTLEENGFDVVEAVDAADALRILESRTGYAPNMFGLSRLSGSALAADTDCRRDAANGLKRRVRSNLLYLSKMHGSVIKDNDRKTATWRLAS